MAINVGSLLTEYGTKSPVPDLYRSSLFVHGDAKHDNSSQSRGLGWSTLYISGTDLGPGYITIFGWSTYSIIWDQQAMKAWCFLREISTSTGPEHWHINTAVGGRRQDSPGWVWISGMFDHHMGPPSRGRRHIMMNFTGAASLVLSIPSTIDSMVHLHCTCCCPVHETSPGTCSMLSNLILLVTYTFLENVITGVTKCLCS
jgi:hypothetical protein